MEFLRTLRLNDNRCAISCICVFIRRTRALQDIHKWKIISYANGTVRDCKLMQKIQTQTINPQQNDKADIARKVNGRQFNGFPQFSIIMIDGVSIQMTMWEKLRRYV